jgi:transposase
VHPADIQDRGGAVLVIEAIHQLFPWLRHLFADSVYNGPNLSGALAKFGNWTIEIVKRAADATGFTLLPRRWVVERTLAWLNRNRRLAKDFEASIASAKAWVYIASVQLLIRRLANLCSAIVKSIIQLLRFRFKIRLTWDDSLNINVLPVTRAIPGRPARAGRPGRPLRPCRS